MQTFHTECEVSFPQLCYTFLLAKGVVNCLILALNLKFLIDSSPNS